MNLIPLGKKFQKYVRNWVWQAPILKGRTIALDTETTGLDPFMGARIFCYSYCTEKGEHGWLPKTPTTTQWVIDILQDPDYRVVFQNAKFDLKMMTFEGLKLNSIKAEIHDTLAMGVLLRELGNHDLGSMVRQWLGINVDTKDSVDEWLRKNNRTLSKVLGRPLNYSDVPRKILKKYAIWDAVHTLKLFYYFLKPIKQNFWKIYRNECDLILCTVEMEKRGVIIDLKRTKELKERAVDDMRWLEKRMRQLVGRDFVIKGTGSKKDLIQVIESDFKWTLQRNPDTGQPSLDEYRLLNYLDRSIQSLIRGGDEIPPRKLIKLAKKQVKEKDIPKQQLFVPMMLKWRALDKMVTTYYTAFESKAIPLKKRPWLAVLHGRFNSLMAITGRFSSSDPNLQNIPRVLGPRQCFKARKGYTNYYFDYSQIEMGLLIHYARDEKLKAAWVAGEDLHMKTAIEIFEKPKEQITKEERKKAKQVNFGINYGSGAKTLGVTLTKMGIPTSTQEAYHYIQKYHEARPSVRRLMNKCKADLERHGYIKNEYGRRFRVPMKVSYKAVNALIQGCAADIMKFAMTRVWRFLKKHKCRSRIIMTIHDEIVVEIHRSEQHLVGKIKRLMEKESKSFWAPISCEIEKSKNYWSDKKAV